jgi:hypothetical protein
MSERDPELAVGRELADVIEKGTTDCPHSNEIELPEVIEPVEAAIREAESEWRVSSRGGDRKLHLPVADGDGQLCSKPATLQHKPIAAYPPGYFEVCKTCAAIWRYRKHGVRSEGAAPEVVADGGEEPFAVGCPACGNAHAVLSVFESEGRLSARCSECQNSIIEGDIVAADERLDLDERHECPDCGELTYGGGDGSQKCKACRVGHDQRPRTDGGRGEEEEGVLLEWAPGEGLYPEFTPANEFVGAVITREAYEKLGTEALADVWPEIERAAISRSGQRNPTAREIRRIVAALTDREPDDLHPENAGNQSPGAGDM